MAKPLKPIITPILPRSKPEDRIPWPSSPKDLSDRPRVFRIHRINAFEWQAFVICDNSEFPIGKPDLFDILIKKVAGVIRAEGQAEYLRERAKAVNAQ